MGGVSMDIEIGLYDSVYKSAQEYYLSSKKNKKKLESALIAKSDLEKKLNAENAKSTLIKERSVAKVKRPTFWFEKFYWSISTNGHLIVAGRDSTTNELLIKKYLEKDDVAFHTNIQGAAFVLLKGGSKAKEVDLKDAALFAGCFSKAWKEGFGSIDVYSITPDQVSKTPGPGEYLPKGSFVIRGEREWYKSMDLRLSFSLLDISKFFESEKIYLPFAGSESAVKKNAKTEISQVLQGKLKKGDAAKKLNSKFFGFLKTNDARYLTLDDFVKQLPSGNMEIR